jgi:hypothetical protein
MTDRRPHGSQYGNGQEDYQTQALLAEHMVAQPGEPHGCAYRKSSPSILVMQSTQDRTAQNAPRCLGGT